MAGAVDAAHVPPRRSSIRPAKQCHPRGVALLAAGQPKSFSGQKRSPICRTVPPVHMPPSGAASRSRRLENSRTHNHYDHAPLLPTTASVPHAHRDAEFGWTPGGEEEHSFSIFRYILGGHAV